jgi:hypothetical protein
VVINKAPVSVNEPSLRVKACSISSEGGKSVNTLGLVIDEIELKIYYYKKINFRLVSP